MRIDLVKEFFCAALCLTSISYSQSFNVQGSAQNVFSAAPTRSFATQLPSMFKEQESDLSFDVLRYALNLHVPMDSSSFSAVESLVVIVRDAQREFDFDAAQVVINSVTSNRGNVSFNLDESAERLHLSVSQAPAIGDTVIFVISYQRAGRPAKGWYYFPQSENILENIGYTMSEPTDAHYWFVCVDTPSVKAASAGISITVPDGYIAASNGALVDVRKNPDGTTTFVWNEAYPITPYLMCVTISKYSHSQTTYETLDKRSIPIGYYTWQQDSSTVAAYLSNVVDMVDYFSKTFREYPFEKYEMTGVYPFYYGGMEHQTLTTLHRQYLTNERVVSHELAHQWWGDLVTCGKWADIWLNEGFASYCEALYAEHKSGTLGLESVMKSFLGSRGFDTTTHSRRIYDPPFDSLFNLAEYAKGAWVLHMLRYVVGDSAFFQILRDYANRFAYRSAVTRDFMNVVNATTGTNYDWFFDQWVFHPGYPIYAATWSVHPTSGQWWTRVVLEQRQSPSYPVFKMPVELQFSGSGLDTIVTVMNDARQQEYDFVFSVAPSAVSIDPDSRILKQVAAVAASAQGKTPIAHVFRLEPNYPNPFPARGGYAYGGSPTTTITYKLATKSRAILRVFNVLGQVVWSVDQGSKDAGSHTVTFDGSSLPSGVYFYQLEAVPLDNRTPVFQDVRKMILLK